MLRTNSGESPKKAAASVTTATSSNNNNNNNNNDVASTADAVLTEEGDNNAKEVKSDNFSDEVLQEENDEEELASTNNSSNKEVTPINKPPKPTTKIIKTYPQYKTQMEEVFAINIRPITPSLINNFYSSEFAIPGGNNTKIFRLDSSTLICGMITN